MLSKEKRLNRAKFNEAYVGGSTKSSSHFSIRIVGAETPRFSVVVSKKVAGTSILRNTLRRKVYGIIERHIPKKPASVIFFAKKGIQTLSKKQLEDEVTSLLKSV